MLIRSQDKETLINFNNSIVVNIIDIEGVVKIICSYSCEDYIIGHYSTKEKSLKVLDMIQEAYADYQTAHTVSNGLATMSLFVDCSDETNELYMKAQNALGKSTVFQMPADSEVEA